MKIPAAKRLLAALGLLFGLLAACAAAWSWRQATRPGRVHFERGLDYAAAKQMPQAEQEWLAGVRQDPGFPDNRAQLGDLYSALGRFRDAAGQYQDAIKLTPQDGSLFLRLARADEAGGEDEAALKPAERAAALRPEDAEAQGNFGVLAAKLNRPELALPPLTRAHSLSRDDADILIYLVRVEFQMHDLSGAERDLTPFVGRHPDNAEACYLMASLLHQKPQTAASTQTALDYAQRAHAASPHNEQACVLLGQLYLEAQNPSGALPLFQQAQQTAPFSQDVLHGLVTCYTRLGRPALAAHAAADLKATVSRRTQLSLLQDRLHLHPDDTAAALDAAHLEEENKELPLARTYYRQAVRYAPQDARARAALDAFLQRMDGHSARHPSK